MNVIVLPISPFIQTTFPEINRSVALREWARLRQLLRRTSWIAAGWTLATGFGLVLLGPVGLAWFKNGQYLPALPIILILFTGFSFANLFYWNRPLLLAFERPNFPLLVTFSVGLIKTLLMFLLVRTFGVIMQALLLSGYFIISIGIIVWKGLRLMQKAQEQDIQKGLTG
jgi:O-antigen/teichoic acid export membrane protein